MFDIDSFDLENDNNRISFHYSDEYGNVGKNISITINDQDSYDVIVQQFVYFLHAIGYSYIGGLVVLNDKGDEIHTTDL
jgi:hypothetical protein